MEIVRIGRGSLEIAKNVPWVSGRSKRVSLSQRASNAAEYDVAADADVDDASDDDDDADDVGRERRLRLVQLMTAARSSVGFVAAKQARVPPCRKSDACRRVVRLMSA